MGKNKGKSNSTEMKGGGMEVSQTNNTQVQNKSGGKKDGAQNKSGGRQEYK